MFVILLLIQKYVLYHYIPQQLSVFLIPIHSDMLQEKGYTPMTLLAMLVFAAFTRQSRPSSSTLIVRFSLIYRHASLHAIHSQKNN